MGFMDDLEAEARAHLVEARVARENRDPSKVSDYVKLSKVHLGYIGNYVRLRATLANEHGNALIERRFLMELQPSAPVKQIGPRLPTRRQLG